ncbi:hypothetical protein GQ607_014815 [Colletotrichum asianum]|uniref:Uncharacterized protein n=1 Tax=Colletotrichum asianum TaxID=702518 RepID=A0A8H3W457_9PEZI|nr:hypothetical protein GQ607_014815 [Colletotrichum asianum]
MLSQSFIDHTHCSESWKLNSLTATEEHYLVQIGYHRDWTYRSPSFAKPCIQVIYLVGGNSVFLAALESLHRRLSMIPQSFSDGVIVAIGYPLSPDSSTVMCPRRTKDLTPSAEVTSGLEGGADAFLDLIQDKLEDPVERRIQEPRGATIGKEALFGHSLRGIFVLHALCTRPNSFNCFLGGSLRI